MGLKFYGPFVLSSDIFNFNNPTIDKTITPNIIKLNMETLIHIKYIIDIIITIFNILLNSIFLLSYSYDIIYLNILFIKILIILYIKFIYFIFYISNFIFIYL